MFTGIIEQKGKILKKNIQRGGGLRLLVGTPFKNLKIGESIAMDGVCLTVIGCRSGQVEVELGSETLRCSNFAQKQAGDFLNLERSLVLGSRLGGHIVQGHVDAVGTLISRKKEASSELYGFEFPQKIRRYLVPKGSIAIDGISLTIFNISAAQFFCSILPYTSKQTTLGQKKIGDAVNLEGDFLCKLLVEQLQPYLKGMKRDGK